VAAEKVVGSILPMNDHRFLLEVVGESTVSFGAVASAVSSFESVAREEWRLYAVSCVVLLLPDNGFIMPSKPTNKLDAGL
jgi:hypothetical protein